MLSGKSPVGLPPAYRNWAKDRAAGEDGVLLFCKLCCEHKPDVIGGGKGGDVWWTRGCRRLKLHYVKDYEASSTHKMSVTV